MHREMAGDRWACSHDDGKHILIVDDYPDALDMWAIYLRAMGYQVSTAGDGVAALAEAERCIRT